MAQWRIDIDPQGQGAPARFEFAQTPDVRPGDLVFWRNNDTKAHFPTPTETIQNGVCTPADFSFMTDQIAPNAPSAAFAVGTAGTIKYRCSLHEGEVGTINISGADSAGTVA